MAIPKITRTTYVHGAVLAAITVAVFYSLVKSLNVTGLSMTLTQARWRWLGLGIIVGAFSPALNTIRWRSLLSGMGHHVSTRRIFLITMANWPFTILPGRVGDFLKSYPLKNEIPVGESVIAVVAERVIDVVSLLSLIVAGSLVRGLPRPGGIAATAILAIVAGVMLLHTSAARAARWTLLRRWQTRIEQFRAVMLRLGHKRVQLAKAAASSLGNWLVNIVMTYCFFQAFRTAVPFSLILTYLPIAIFIGLIPVTLAGMGTRDAALIGFFSAYARPEQSLSVGIAYSVVAYWLMVVIGLGFLYRFKDAFWPRSTD